MLIRTSDDQFEVSNRLINCPSFAYLYLCLPRNHFQRQRISLNYKDRTGDLIEMTEQSDIELMKAEGIPPRRQSEGQHAPWALYVTEAGDHIPYNTDPYKR